MTHLRINRRTLLTGTVALGTVGLLAACGGGGNFSTPNMDSPSLDSQGVKTPGRWNGPRGQGQTELRGLWVDAFGPGIKTPEEVTQLVDTARAAADAPLVVGFAAETGDADGGVLDHARAKLARKGCDVLVVNEVGPDKTFGRDETVVHVLRRGTEDAVEIAGSKREVARRMWDVLRSLAPRR